MQTYIADIIPNLQRFSRKLDDLTKLSHQQWVSIDDEANVKTVFIFRGNNELLIYENGIRFGRNSWRYLDSQSIEIEINEISYLMKHAFLDDVILALKRSGVNEYAFFVNETKYGRELKSHSEIIRYLERRYNVGERKVIGLPKEKQLPFEEQVIIGLFIFVVALILALLLFGGNFLRL